MAQLVKNPPAMQETWVWSLGWEYPWRKERLPTPVFWPREFHGLYSPCGLKELDMTDRISLTHCLATAWKCESCSVMSDSLQPHGLYSPWNSPGQNTGVGNRSLLQRIFPIQRLNSGLPHCRKIFLSAEPPGKLWVPPNHKSVPRSLVCPFLLFKT